MSNRKITDMVALTTPASDDVLPIVDISEAAAADKNKKISIEELFKGAPNGTAAAPSIAFESDGDSGIFLAGTNTVGITTAGTQRVTVDSAGKLLVGTTTEGAAIADNLTVEDSGHSGITIRSGTSSLGSLYFSDGTSGAAEYAGFVEYNHNGNYLGFGTGSTTRMRIDSSGNLGLGVSAPGAKLDVYSSSSRYVRSFPSSGLADFEVLSNNNSQPVFAVKGTGSADLFRAFANTTQAVTINSSGNLGVGTAAPAHNLDISPASGAAELKIAGAEGQEASIRLYADQGDDAADIKRFLTDTSGNLKIQHYSGSAFVDSMVINSSGNLGVGTAAPVFGVGTGLEVFRSGVSTVRVSSNNQAVELRSDAGTGTLETRGAFPLKFGTQGSERLRITSDGNCGIGQSNPSGKLEVSGGYVTFRNGASSYPDGISAPIIYGSTGGGSNSFDQTGNLVLQTRSDSGSYSICMVTGDTPTERLRISSDGKVGIGTSPSTKLHVNGSTPTLRVSHGTSQVVEIKADTSASILRTTTNHPLLFGTNDTERLRILSDGKLGVGTSSPGQLLHLNSSASTAIQISDGTNNQFISSIKTAGNIANGSTAGDLLIRGQSGFAVSPNNGSSVALRVDSSGNVGISTTSADRTLHVRKDNAAAVKFGGESGGDYAIEIGQLGSSSSPGFNATGGSSMLFKMGGTEAARLDSSGRLLVGTSSAQTLPTASSFQVSGTDFATSSIRQTRFESGTSGPSIILAHARGSEASNQSLANNDELGKIRFYGHDGTDFHNWGAEIIGEVDGTPGSNDMPGRLLFRTTADGASSPTERARFTSTGHLLVGKTSEANIVTTDGTRINSTGGMFTTRTSNTPILCARQGSDGNLIEFYAQGNSEGSISVSGTSVSYNGGHLSRWSQLASGAERVEILRGSVLSNLDEMCEWGEEDNEQLNRMKVSDVEGDVNVAGVFQAWDDDDDTYINDFYCAMTGDFVIRIAQGTTVARGDLLMSAGDGTAKPQDDDIVRSKTIAKVTSTTVSTTYSDNSYCVPCVLMAC